MLLCLVQIVAGGLAHSSPARPNRFPWCTRRRRTTDLRGAQTQDGRVYGTCQLRLDAQWAIGPSLFLPNGRDCLPS